MKSALLTFFIICSSLLSAQVESPLERILKTDSLDSVKAVVSEHPDVLRTKFRHGRNILFRTQDKSLDINEYLLTAGADANLADQSGLTPVTYNTSDVYLYRLYLNHKGKIVSDKNEIADYLYNLIFDYNTYKQQERFEIINDLVKRPGVKLNRYYSNGLTIAHLIIINALTYSSDTDYEPLIKLLKENGCKFTLPVKKSLDNESYPYNIKAKDNYKQIVSKITKHMNYNKKGADALIRLIEE